MSSFASDWLGCLPPMPHFPQDATRREFLREAGGGFGAIALASLLGNEALAFQSERATNASARRPLEPRATHFEPRAKRIIWLFMHGGPSHVDLFDPKPELIRYAGEP